MEQIEQQIEQIIADAFGDNVTVMESVSSGEYTEYLIESEQTQLRMNIPNNVSQTFLSSVVKTKYGRVIQ